MSLRLVNFLDLFAWTTLTVSLLAFALGLYLDVTYTLSVDFTVDTLRGQRRTFTWGRYLLLAFACSAWLWTGRVTASNASDCIERGEYLREDDR